MDLNEKLREYFNDDELDRYIDATANDIAEYNFHQESYGGFYFACIDAAKWLLRNGNQNEENRYYQTVRQALKLDSDSSEKDHELFGLSFFIQEMFQNSLDHCSDDSDVDIECSISPERLHYKHNGKPFGFEEDHISSTMKGLFLPNTSLKSYDFRIGRFGIGFKSWVIHFGRFKLTATANGDTFTSTITVQKDGKGREILLEDINFSQTGDDDGIEFEFTNPNTKIDISRAVVEISEKIQFTLSTWINKSVQMTLVSQPEESERASIVFSTEVSEEQIGDREFKCVTLTKNGEVMQSSLVVNLDISSISDSSLVHWSGQKDPKCVQAFIEDRFTDVDDNVTVDFGDWFTQLHKLVVNKEIPDSEQYILSSLTPIDTPKHQSNNILFDSQYMLSSNRKSVVSYGEGGVLNQLIIKEMLSQYYQLGASFSEDPEFYKLMFSEPSSTIRDELIKEDAHWSDVTNSYETVKPIYEKAMRNVSANKISELELTPLKLPFSDKFVSWCNENIPLEDKQKFFIDVPAIGNQFILSKNSMAVRELKEMFESDLVSRIQESKLYSKMYRFFLDNDELKQQIATLPLPGGYECVILQEKEIEDVELRNVISEIRKARKCIKLIDYKEMKYFADYDSILQQQIETNLPKSRHSILKIQQATIVTDVLQFILNNLGGKHIDDKDWELLRKILSSCNQDLLVEAEVSRWDEEEFTDKISALMEIPSFDREHQRSIFVDDVLPSGWLGWPKWDETSFKTDKAWWHPKALPRRASDGRLLILKHSDVEKSNWIKKDDLCVFLGSPINKEAICNAFGKVILGKSTNFLKVDVTPEFNQLALKRWRSPFPKVMRISSFLDHEMQEYNPTNLIKKDNHRVTDSKGHVSKAVELSENVGSANIKIPKDQHNVYGRALYYINRDKAHILSKFSNPAERLQQNNDFMHSVVWPKLRNKKKTHLNSSGFFLEFVHIFEHLIEIDDNKEYNELKMYSLVAWFVTGNKAVLNKNYPRIRRTFAGRFGSYSNNGNYLSFAMSWFCQKGLDANTEPGKMPQESGNYLFEKSYRTFLNEKRSLFPIVGRETSRQHPKEISISNFSDNALKCSNFEIGLSQFLLDTDLEEIRDWWTNSIDTRYQMLDFSSYKLKLSQERVGELSNLDIGQNWKEFVSKVLDSESREELLSEFENLMNDSRLKALEQLRKPKSKYHAAFVAYKAGEVCEVEVGTKNYRFISNAFFNKYFESTKIGDSERYLRWHPAESFRVLPSHIANRLIVKGNQRETLAEKDLLIRNSGDVIVSDIEDMKLDGFELEIPEKWAQSLKIFFEFVRSLNRDHLQLEDYKFKFMKSGETAKLFNNKLQLGRNGWDIRHKDGVMVFLKGVQGEVRNQAKCLAIACEKYLRVVHSKFHPDIVDRWRKHLHESTELSVFGSGIIAWLDEYSGIDVQAYQSMCNPGDIENLYQKLLRGLREIWENKGAVAPDSEGDKLMTMRLNLREEERSTDGFRDTKFEQMFEQWYSDKSMAGDEPKVIGDLRCLRKNVFASHPVARRRVAGKNRNEGVMKHHQINTFFGAQIQVDTILGRWLDNPSKELVMLNNSNGRSLRNSAIEDIINGNLIIPADGILLVRDGLLIQGRPSTLRIHVFHMVAMAAVESLLDEVE